jgi:SAM-dependent methyltransferase
MNELKKIKTPIARPEISRRNSQSLFKILARELLYPPIYWFLSHIYHVPGLHIQAIIYFLGLKLLAQGKLRLVTSQKLLSSPMDSVRYFEFDFFYHRFIYHSDFKNYLDVSSPRLFPTLILHNYPHIKAAIVNPDIKDLNITKELVSACGFENRCRLLSDPIANLTLPEESFDIITSMSVIEHIPGDGDVIALKKMWSLLRPNGKLFISVPCARIAFEEYTDYNEYGLLTPDEDSYVYGQRFYDKKLIEDRFWNITGIPTNIAIYGEKQEGFFINSRQERLTSADYPFWREPYMMGLNYSKYASIEDLPGIGVITLEFVK